MTGMDDPTISCSHLMVELGVLAGQEKKSVRGVATTPPPFGRRGLKHNLSEFETKKRAYWALAISKSLNYNVPMRHIQNGRQNIFFFFRKMH